MIRIKRVAKGDRLDEEEDGHKEKTILHPPKRFRSIAKTPPLLIPIERPFSQIPKKYKTDDGRAQKEEPISQKGERVGIRVRKERHLF